MTLDKIAMGTSVRVVGFKYLREAECVRLSALGVQEEATITKLMNTPLKDPIECLVGPQLLTLDAWLLGCILVSSP